MRRPRMGLQSRFFAAILLLLALLVLVMVLVWQRQQSTQHEVSEVTRVAMHGLLSEQLRVDGEAEVRQLADGLANPLYFFDLDAIGALALVRGWANHSRGDSPAKESTLRWLPETGCALRGWPGN